MNLTYILKMLRKKDQIIVHPLKKNKAILIKMIIYPINLDTGIINMNLLGKSLRIGPIISNKVMVII